jgi:uncharacterized integral membrane protein (TIGR00697 family)
MSGTRDDFVVNRRVITIMFCFYLSAVALTVADLSSVKITQFTAFGYQFIVPAGTIAFAVTFICTDVIIELSNRFMALILLLQTLIVRVLAVLYFIWVVGPGDGSMPPFEVPPFWTPENQAHISFTLSGTVPIYIAGFLAIFLGFVFDIYVYSHLREKQRGKNTFWWRNAISTILGQTINSIVFVAIAFAAVLTPAEILSAIVGMVILKIILAVIDPSIAVMMRNWGEGRAQWWAFWRRNLRVDFENYNPPSVPSTR